MTVSIESTSNGGSVAPPTLTPSQIAIVKSTVPILKERGVEITSLFYKNMLEEHPELHNIFNRTSQVTGAQPRALATAVLAYASYVDNLPVLSSAVELIAHKHASLHVLPEQYPIVGKHLISAVATVLGPEIVTAEVAEAWTNAYAVLADVFIKTEEKLYNAHADWIDWRKFKILEKNKESSEITSFILAPEDGRRLPSYKPGQYISVRVFVPEWDVYQPRQYSLSDAPNEGGMDHYRISVKREQSHGVGPEGLVSNILHDKLNVGDVVELTHPQGEFFADPKVTDVPPMVLISAGVGLTPMLSILKTFAPRGQPISWIHGARSETVRAFNNDVEKVAAEHANVTVTRFLSEPKGSSVDTSCEFRGRIELNKVDPEKQLFLSNPKTKYYICGPTSFMFAMKEYLTAQGVPADRVQLELFGTGGI